MSDVNTSRHAYDVQTSYFQDTAGGGGIAGHLRRNRIAYAGGALMLAIAIGVRRSSPGPVVFKQRRYGLDGKEILVYKFRSMTTTDNGDVVKQATKNDPRITRVGAFLRKTSLDEFPQFWNVLKGDMSVVGPRPLVPDELYMYGDRMDKVLTIKPGITGLWQVSGRNDIPYERRVKIDVYYVNNRNFWLDVWIIIKTLGVVFFPNNNGAY